jgi:hypothetical protein
MQRQIDRQARDIIGANTVLLLFALFEKNEVVYYRIVNVPKAFNRKHQKQ